MYTIPSFPTPCTFNHILNTSRTRRLPPLISAQTSLPTQRVVNHGRQTTRLFFVSARDNEGTGVITWEKLLDGGESLQNELFQRPASGKPSPAATTHRLIWGLPHSTPPTRSRKHQTCRRCQPYRPVQIDRRRGGGDRIFQQSERARPGSEKIKKKKLGLETAVSPFSPSPPEKKLHVVDLAAQLATCDGNIFNWVLLISWAQGVFFETWPQVCAAWPLVPLSVVVWTGHHVTHGTSQLLEELVCSLGNLGQSIEGLHGAVLLQFRAVTEMFLIIWQGRKLILLVLSSSLQSVGSVSAVH